MIISIQSKVVDGPWGGGNLFVQNLVNYLTSNGLKVLNDLYNPKIDLILMTDPLKQSISTNFSFKQISYYKKYINPNVKIVHRVNECDERKNTNNVNKEIIHCNSIADSTIFVSNWLMNLFENIGLHNNNKVINSGSNRDIFNNLNKPNWDGFSNIKIVTHHWGTNESKGFEIYKYLDELIYNKKIQNIEFTYIGNLPKNISLKKTTHIEPIQGKTLSQELKKHHIYLTASINEPSGNHHIEGAQCGLPLLFINSGGIVEYCKNYGIQFFGVEDFETSLNELIRNYDIYFEKVADYPNNSNQMCFEYLNEFNSVLDSEKLINHKNNIFQYIYKLIYVLNRLKSELI
ncbi:hypothetical protein N8734_01835 [Acidimicrobiia bacterium]|jgi:hypothetical protein|nr:hypothetical protein [Acidimicrobiia bacterium]